MDGFFEIVGSKATMPAWVFLTIIFALFVFSIYTYWRGKKEGREEAAEEHRAMLQRAGVYVPRSNRRRKVR